MTKGRISETYVGKDALNGVQPVRVDVPSLEDGDAVVAKTLQRVGVRPRAATEPETDAQRLGPGDFRSRRRDEDQAREDELHVRFVNGE